MIGLKQNGSEQKETPESRLRHLRVNGKPDIFGLQNGIGSFHGRLFSVREGNEDSEYEFLEELVGFTLHVFEL